MKIRITQLKQKLDDYQLPLTRVAARALHVKEQDILSATLRRKSVDARDKSDVHFTLTLDVETSRPVKPLPRGAEILSLPLEGVQAPGKQSSGLHERFARRPLGVAARTGR